jgi:spore germination protein
MTLRTTFHAMLAGTVLTALLSACGGLGAGTPAPRPTPLGMGAARRTAPSTRLRMLAFYDQTSSPAPPHPLVLLRSHPGLVTDLAPFWYEVEASGNVISKPQGDILSVARAQHLKLVPLFNNAQGTDAFLHSAATRRVAVDHIVHLVARRHYAGVNIDFQGLKAADRTDLTRFMTLLDRRMPKGTLVSMSVVPLSNQNGMATAYDYAALDRVTDAMVLMAYDLHGDGTNPGPVSPLAWVKQAVRTALAAGIQPSKLYLGIADYGYDWAVGSTKATTVPLKLMHQHHYGPYRWVPSVAEATASYVKDGVRHVIWFVPDRGAVARIRVAQADHLAGIAVWRLGYEDAKWWNAVAGALNRPTGVAAGVRAHPRATPRRTPQHRGHP